MIYISPSTCVCPEARRLTVGMLAMSMPAAMQQVYFRLNTLRLCKNLINAVHSRQFTPFDAFPASQRVTYKYYTGRLAIFDENYVSPALPSRHLWSFRDVHALIFESGPEAARPGHQPAGLHARQLA